MDFSTPRSVGLLDAIADLEIAGLFLILLLFLVVYMREFAWTRYGAGRSFVTVLVGLEAVLILNFVGRFFGPAPEAIRFAVYTAFFLSVTYLAITILRYARHGRAALRKAIGAIGPRGTKEAPETESSGAPSVDAD